MHFHKSIFKLLKTKYKVMAILLLRSTLTTCRRLKTLTEYPCSVNNVVSPIFVRTCTHQSKFGSNTSAWNQIYKFPSIKLLSDLSKLKIYQSALTAIGVPVLMGLEMFQMAPHQTAEHFGVIGVTGTISLCVYSLFATNVIGFVYVNPELKQIRFAYIDFWGRRKHQDLTLDELLSADEKWMLNSCTVIKTKTAAGSFKLLRYGDITDPEVFHMIFGDM